MPASAAEFVMFTVKQGWASLFGALLLAGLIVTDAIWQETWIIARYDALLIYAISLQAILLILRIETWAEMRIILLFHLTGTAMELFKVHMGSWSYPGDAMTKIAGVPLFSGFMYASVGSYIARVMRVFDMRFAPFPPVWALWALSGLIYANFFAHHFLPDIRVVLIVGSVLLFWRTRVWFRMARFYWMPMPVAGALVALFMWVAENIGTATSTWLYAGQLPGDPVNFSKMGSWYMLLYLAFGTVTLVSRDALMRSAWAPVSQKQTVQAT